MNIKCSYSELVDVVKCIPNPKNPNKHPQEQIEKLARIIKYQGIRHPIIISKLSGFICAGHARLEALKILELTQVPVDYQDFENEAQEYAFMVSDNAIQEFYANTDLSMVDKDFIELGPDFDIDLLAIPNFNLNKSDFEPDLPGEFEEIKTMGDDHSLIVTTDNEKVFEELFHELKNRGLKVKIK